MNVLRLDRERLQSVATALPDGPLAARRREAAERFAEIGFPTHRDEDWKYTNLSGAFEISKDWLSTFDAAAKPAVDGSDIVSSVVEQIDVHWIVLRDGIVDDALPAIDGVRLDRFCEQAPSGDDDESPMSLFNAALLQDGVHISVPAGQSIEKPIGIILVDSPSNAVSQTRVQVDVGENGQLQLVECLVSAIPGRQFTNSVTDLRLAAGARIDHVRIQSRDRAHTGVARIAARLDRDAMFHHNGFDFGGALTRTDLVADIAGAGADVSLNGLYLASGEQHVDNHTSIVHGVGPARSREEYRGILSGRSRCVFNGKVVVAKGADGTDSGQSNHNLLLSDRAEIDTKPELEIYADDVKCAHGATVGQLDETALFYLRSRGIDPEAARRMITRAFAAGTLATLSVEPCRAYLEALLDRRLEALVGTDDD